MSGGERREGKEKEKGKSEIKIAGRSLMIFIAYKPHVFLIVNHTSSTKVLYM